MLFQLFSTLGEAFSRVILGIRAVVGARVPHAPALAPQLFMAQNRLGRMLRRLDLLAWRWQCGRRVAPRPARPRPVVPATARAARPPSPDIPLPRGRGWLIRMAQTTAQHVGVVEAFIADPATRALVEAAPQAGRILRPLCQMLGLEPPPWIALPAKPKPVVVPTKKPRVRQKPEPHLRPLQPYVLGAMRAWGTKWP